MAEELSAIAVDFDEFEKGALTKSTLQKYFGNVAWATLEGRAVIREGDGGKLLEVLYPEAKVASRESGAQFVIALKGSRYGELTYRFRMAEAFPFVKGGKLPGLASGGSQFTGGRPPGEEGGWSARYMWRREGALELYFYHPKMKEQYGERHSLNTRLVPGEWVDISQRIDVGEKGKQNGRLVVTVNGKVQLSLDALELHGSRYGLVDSFLFSSFFGGGSASWAPPRDTSIVFDDIEVSTEKPNFSAD